MKNIFYKIFYIYIGIAMCVGGFLGFIIGVLSWAAAGDPSAFLTYLALMFSVFVISLCVIGDRGFKADYDNVFTQHSIIEKVSVIPLLISSTMLITMPIYIHKLYQHEVDPNPDVYFYKFITLGVICFIVSCVLSLLKFLKNKGILRKIKRYFNQK